MMDYLFEISERLISHAPEAVVRNQLAQLSEGGRMIGIKGARGVGKSTLLLQFARMKLQDKKKIYVSLDDIAFAQQGLADFADAFVKRGGEYLLIDEVHSYSGWAREMKNIYDRYPGLHVLFTGSSMLQLSEGLGELSRRAVIYDLPGLSFREYIQFATGKTFDVIPLSSILSDHQQIAKTIWQEIRPLQHFEDYLRGGYYPYYFENPQTYDLRLRETVVRVIESDLLLTTGISPASMEKVKQLLHIISHSVPFKPNIDKLAERMQTGKNNLKAYFRYLDLAGLTRSLFSAKKGISLLTKPEKVYLSHPNIMHSLNPGEVNPGTQRESFLLSQLAPIHTVHEPDRGDFLVDRSLLLEVGGKNKTAAQISGEENAWLAIDGIETGYGNRIPLWLFGFLY
ncbi:MAG: AAA family ATPase [Candidatus Cyclonatronum sp.]|uniref:ATP-binding protein n=1 Tax=Cyclonatronum sp. TaxID=3024185 RepID=UPI0025BF72D4|nr:AAA family ATPase [Cyclonatronum sp.]MCH8486709.1 AAA family ATPase [Cyclonatronum sp.]